MTESTSISLLEQLRTTSDSGAWNRFVGLYDPFIVGYLRKRGVQEHDARDIAQEVLAVLVRELPGFQHNERPGAFRKWLRTVTANRMRTFWRQQQRQPKALGGSDFVGFIEQLSDPDSQMTQLWDREYYRHVLARLFEIVAPRFRSNTLSAFQRVVVEGQDAEAVANELGMTVNAVWIAQGRVMKAMHDLGVGLLD